MTKYTIHNGTLYDYTAGVLCGVLVKERVMRKLAALQARHLEDVKRVLSDGVDNGEVFPSSWSLHYPNGRQEVVKYIEVGESVQGRIQSAITANPPKACKTVFIASGMEEATQMADARFAEVGGEG
jgi:hypothetical protein